MYYSYHAVAKKRIAAGQLQGILIVEAYHGIAPAMLLLFDDPMRPVMPIRVERWADYLPLLAIERKRKLQSFLRCLIDIKEKK
ncbi:MAG: thermostable hemolysin delta-VPH [Ruminococcaceae bacterium]|nr:thermostable hemolysin delta-VPH [Oscillospiraceae bacterium]